MNIQDNKFRKIASLILESMNDLFDYNLFPNFEEINDDEDVETKYYKAEDLITSILEESINEVEIANAYELKWLKDDIEHYLDEEDDEFEDITIDDVNLGEAKKIIDSSPLIAESYWSVIESILSNIKKKESD